MQGRQRVAKGRRAEAHAGATIQPIHTVAVDRIVENDRASAKGLERYTTQQIYGELLARFDENPTRDGLLKTPERVEKAMTFLTQGYRQHPQEILRAALFDVDYDEMVMVKDIEMYSLCEHHLLPFFGKVHIAYIPNGKVVGLSKLPRLVDVFARRLQVQERMTREIAGALQEAIAPQGVGVVVEARHLCMMMRGVEKQNSSTVTSSMSGVFLEDKTRAEFLSLVRDHGRNSF
jgi:GTP cyclohydrolase I